MSIKILADEDVHFKIVTSLRNKKFEVISILENYKSISDLKALELSQQMNALLLTEDSDFGEWIFSYKKQNTGIIFLRYKVPEIDNIISALIIVLNTYKEDLYGKFVVITKNKIRIRDTTKL